MKNSFHRPVIAAVALALLAGSCYKDPVDEYVEPGQIPWRDYSQLEWVGAIDGPEGVQPEMAQGNDTSLMYITVQTEGGIKVARSDNYGENFTHTNNLVTLPGPSNTAATDPVLLALPAGEVLMAYARTIGSGPEARNGVGLMRSTDYGISWERDQDIVAISENNYPIAGPSLISFENELLCFYSRKVADTIPVMHVWMTRSSDKGVTWSEPVKVLDETQLELDGTAESVAVVQDSIGGFIMVFQGKDLIYKNEKSVLISRSVDAEIWSDPATLFSPPGTDQSYGAANPDLVTAPDGRLFVSFQYGTHRERYGIVESTNNGVTWSDPSDIFTDETVSGTSLFLADNGYLFAATGGTRIYLTSMDGKVKLTFPFYLFPRHNNGICIDANYPWPAENNNIHFWAWEADKVQKLWKLNDNDDGTFWLQPLSGIETGKAVQIMPDGNIQLQPITKGDNQLWYVEATNGGFYNIISKLNGHLFTAEGGGTTNGTNLIAAADAGVNYQEFRAESTNPGYSPFEDFLAGYDQ
ncbi:MAG: exo-alpha-sialidase [Bacteroidota bacterium]